ncbi:Conserved_hypothetical protein [Hexamita inflata]|uniref:Uncharacterized protein n=1 Tax=Hexamita inflata TaxID=28002 RepID=A0AA86NL40_9EUKA|nr:Conserved hypothetical protein [Hexamita inflata]
MNASINVSINTVVGKCALICITCDMSVTKSTLILTAQGQIVAGLALEIEDTIQLSQLSIQIRMESLYGAGLVQQITKIIQFFTIFETNLSVSSLADSENNGYLVSQLNVTQYFQIQNLIICSTLKETGYSIYELQYSQSLQHNCNMCDNAMVVYGLCLQDLLFGQNVNGTLLCVSPFEFNGMSCSCQSGYELNISVCINLIQQLTTIEVNTNLSVNSLNSQINSMQQSISKELLELENKTSLMYNQLNQIIDNNILSNISASETKFHSLLSKFQNSTEQSLNTLDTRLFNNISSITIQFENSIQQNISYLNSSILSRIQQSDERLIQNVSLLQQYINTTQNQTDQHIIGNISDLQTLLQTEQNALFNNIVQNIVTNSTTLEQRIMSNASLLQSQMSQLSTNIQNDINTVKIDAYTNLTNGINTVNLNLNSNISALKSYVDSQMLFSDQYVISNLSQLQLLINSTRDTTELRLLGNISHLKTQLQLETNNGLSNTVQLIVQNSTTLEQRIMSNASLLQSQMSQLSTNIQNDINTVKIDAYTNLTNGINTVNLNLNSNISALKSYVDSQMLFSDQYVISNLSQLQLLINSTRDTTELRLLGNISHLKTQLQLETNNGLSNTVQLIVQNSTTLEQRIMSNASLLQSQMSQLSTNIQNDINTVQIDAYTNLTNGINTINANMNNNISALKSYLDSQMLFSDQYVISNVSQLEQFVNSTRDTTELRIQGNISNLRAQLQSETNTGLQNTVQLIVQNSTALEQRIISNATQLQNNINILATNSKADLEALRLQVDSNLTSSINALNTNINNNIAVLNSSVLSQLLANSTVLEQRILNNFTTLTDNMTSQTTTINQGILSTQNQQTLINQDINSLKQIIQYFGVTVCAFSSKTYNNGICN